MALGQNFMVPYNNTDISILIQDQGGSPFAGINVCKYLWSGIEGKIVTVAQEDKQIELEFKNRAIANQAAFQIEQAVDNLKKNCPINQQQGGGGGTPSSAVSITLANYINDANNNNLTPFAWYDISDSSNELGNGVTSYRVQAISDHDKQPVGYEIQTDNRVVLNLDFSFGLNQIHRLEQVIKNNIIIPWDTTINIDNQSNDIRLNNCVNSSIANCQSIYAQSSKALLSDCTSIKVYNSNDVKLANSSNVSITNVELDFINNYGISLNDVSIDKTDTLGRYGVDDNFDFNNKNEAYAYKDYMILEVPNNINSNEEIKLINPIKQANARFMFHNKITDVGKNFTIKDEQGNLIGQIDYKSNSGFIYFDYDKQNDTFSLNYDLSFAGSHNWRDIFQPQSNGQTSFSNIFTLTPFVVTEVYLNGVLVENNDYNINGYDFIWQNSNVTLDKTDTISIAYETFQTF